MMKKKERRSGRSSGQGLIEFILSLFAFFTVLFMYVQLAIGLGVANYFQYATFMSARALLSADSTENDQIKSATSVLKKMVQSAAGVDRYKGVAKGSGEGDPPGSRFGRGWGKGTGGIGLKGPEARVLSWEQGVVYKFKLKMYMMPLVPGAKKGEANTLELQSETWLGREPSEKECLEILQSRMKDKSMPLFDNGC